LTHYREKAAEQVEIADRFDRMAARFEGCYRMAAEKMLSWIPT
jgi:hypothetical protein